MSDIKESYREKASKPVFRSCPLNPKLTLRNTSEGGNATVDGITEEQVV
jgi:hypothetical protein